MLFCACLMFDCGPFFATKGGHDQANCGKFQPIRWSARKGKFNPLAESKSRLTGEFTTCQKVRLAFPRVCLEVGGKAACDFAYQCRDGHLHAADFLVVEHHLLR